MNKKKSNFIIREIKETIIFLKTYWPILLILLLIYLLVILLRPRWNFKTKQIPTKNKTIIKIKSPLEKPISKTLLTGTLKAPATSPNKKYNTLHLSFLNK